MQGFTPENLDCITIDEKEMANLAEVYRRYADYCRIKSLAMIARKEGNIQTAIQREDVCDNIYKNLPEWAKW